MPEVERTALVMHSAPQMYALVNDVARYAEFLPGCIATKVMDESAEHMLAEMTLRKGPITQVFSTSNTLLPGKSIAMQLNNGPFEYLEGGWTFTPLSEEACKIAFSLNFKFSNRLVGAAFGSYFSELTLSMVDAFTKRANEVYGGQL
ncbi:MAG: type II toxin-antitoxin system RatA family toxin [Gammaproteobacteria bacterium]|nr:type II toxin-antitoxin system RatA family toxin [Gammaproteobacteria bacterium]NNJ73208.1 type II toxin-antitoxin system RatA family toxin [Enterobacterales bacterium]